MQTTIYAIIAFSLATFALALLVWIWVRIRKEDAKDLAEYRKRHNIKSLNKDGWFNG